MLDLFKLSVFLSLNPVFPKRKIICFLFQTMKNYWVWRKCFEKVITILNVWAVLNSIIRVSFFQLVSIGRLFIEELKILNKNLIQYLYIFILIRVPTGPQKPSFLLVFDSAPQTYSFLFFFSWFLLISPQKSFIHKYFYV